MNRLSNDAGSSHFQAKPISWSMRTRGSVPRIHTKTNTKTYVLSINQSSPATQSRLTNATPRTTATATRLKMTKPMTSACQPGIELRASQNDAAKISVPTTGTSAMRISSPIPSEPGSRARLIAGNGNGAFQPPKNSVTVSAETMKTLTYSAKKKNPNRIPEYSVANPATISESSSVRSNGVRFASAVAAMKKIRKPSGCRKMYQSRNEPDWLSTIVLRLMVPASISRPTTDRVSGIS